MNQSDKNIVRKDMKTLTKMKWPVDSTQHDRELIIRDATLSGQTHLLFRRFFLHDNHIAMRIMVQHAAGQARRPAHPQLHSATVSFYPLCLSASVP